MKLPSDTELGLLVALGAQRLTGRQLATRYEEQTGRSINYGSLYVILGRLKEQGWVSQEDDEDEDGRLRFFKIKGDGVDAINRARKFYSKLLGMKGAVA